PQAGHHRQRGGTRARDLSPLCRTRLGAVVKGRAQSPGKQRQVVNRAGGVPPLGYYRLSEDGFELTFAVNHLAPFLLTNLLLDRLKAPDRNMTRRGLRAFRSQTTTRSTSRKLRRSRHCSSRTQMPHSTADSSI